MSVLQITVLSRAEENLKEHITLTSEKELVSSKRARLTAEMEATLLKSPRIKIYKITAPESCTHEVAYPPEIAFEGLVEVPGPKVRTFPFTLDAFQQQAVLCIDNNRSVMVSAHTSAGKTVVAEYVFVKILVIFPKLDKTCTFISSGMQ